MAKYSSFENVPLEKRDWPNNKLTKAPIWCSVDLRDGNQALATPMSVPQKLAFFDLLVKTGFKEIEVGFPTASQTEYDFLRILIEQNRIPKDVTIQVLCQARESLILRTLECLKDASDVIFHLYNSTSPAQRNYTFSMTKEEIIKMALDSVELIKKNYHICESKKFLLEYSPESFSDTECDFALEICNKVIQKWEPTKENPIIINLPATVENSLPNVYADKVEYIVKNIASKDNVIISVHTHNDMGYGNSATMLALLAGAERVEGTIFGNGERTGNCDLVIEALNLYSLGINPKLDFYNIPLLVENYTRLTGMDVSVRHPYAGSLVFTAFSGSHQDAIRKGLKARKQLKSDDKWDVPYLHVDPRDIGRQYEELIRINSLSGKGGASYILEEDYGIIIPRNMQSLLGAIVTEQADKLQRELSPGEIYSIFENQWLNKDVPLKLLDIVETHVDGTKQSDIVSCRASISWNSKVFSVGEKGNGPLDAFVQALRQIKELPSFVISDFHEHSIGSGSDTDAMAYINLKVETSKDSSFSCWGVGKSSSIGRAGINATISALNQYMA